VDPAALVATQRVVLRADRAGPPTTDEQIAYKIPARWVFTSTFPLTATGKMGKDVLSAQLADAPGSAGLGAAGVSGFRGDAPPAVRLNDLDFAGIGSRLSGLPR
jgi:hypothetical protein